MLSIRSFTSLWLYFIFINYVRADWPPSLDSSNIQLLGLFSYISNTSELTISSVHARAMFKAAIVLSRKYNIKIEGQFFDWKSAETTGDVMGALSHACRLIPTSNIVGIVGPELSRESHFIAPFAEKIGIPVVSYGATDPELSDRNVYPAFYRTVPSDNAAAIAIVKLFFLFNWTSCIIIYQNDAFGLGGANAISEAFADNELTITEMIVFEIETRTIRSALKHLTTSSTRIVLVWAAPEYTEIILRNALDDDVLGPRFLWILSANIRLDKFNSALHNKLTGMLIVEPIVGSAANAPINNTLLTDAYNIWKEYEPKSFPGSDNVDYYALFAFDATWALIQSLSKFCSKLNNTKCISFTNTSFCFDRHLYSPKQFFNALNDTTFLGVSGLVQFNSHVTDRINGTYYVAKNVQRSSNSLNQIPMLVWSEINDWIYYTQSHTIVWPGNSFSLPTGYASVAGITLRIAVIESKPFTMAEEVRDASGRTTTKLTGYAIDLINLLQNKMEFNSDIILVPLNQTYNGLIDAVQKNEYDMVVADMTMTASRMKKVGFSSSIFDNSLRIVIREATIPNVDLISYLRPFSFQVWITLLIATVYAGFLIYFLEREHNEALRNEPIFSLTMKSMWYSIGTILGYGVDFHVRTAAGRLLTIGLYVLSLVSVAAYTAKLASDLTISNTRGIISGIEDIKNGKISFSRIGILTNTSIEDYYLREISSDNRNFYPLKTEQEMYENLFNNIIDASIMDAGVVEYSTSNVYCNLTLVGTDFDKNAFGIIFQKNWLYQQYLDVNILSLRESGELDKLKRNWFQANRCSRSSIIFPSMTIESMSGLFLTFIVISILSVLLYAWKQRFKIIDYFLLLIHRKNFLKR